MESQSSESHEPEEEENVALSPIILKLPGRKKDHVMGGHVMSCIMSCHVSHVL